MGSARVAAGKKGWRPGEGRHWQEGMMGWGQNTGSLMVDTREAAPRFQLFERFFQGSREQTN